MRIKIINILVIFVGLTILIRLDGVINNHKAMAITKVESPVYLPLIFKTPCVVDNFDSTELGNQWSWVREDPTHWSLIAQPGWLRIITQAGENWETYGPDLKNILLQHIPDAATGLEISTKLVFSPVEDFQSAGLTFYTDDDNYIRLYYGYHSKFEGRSVRFQSEIDSTAEEIGFALDALIIYLKISRLNNTYAGYYSLDNTTWIKIGEYPNGMTTPSIGIMATNGGDEAEEAEANFDYFQYCR